jgi:hypothetical protein
VSSPQFEAFLARLYCDRVFREHFLRDPGKAMSEARLTPREQHAAASIDRASLLLAAHSYERKRAGRGWRRHSATLLARARRAALHAAARLFTVLRYR